MIPFFSGINLCFKSQALKAPGSVIQTEFSILTGGLSVISRCQVHKLIESIPKCLHI
jgi:hypothetical protein